MKRRHGDHIASRAAGRPHANPKSFRAQIIAMLGDGKPRDAQTILDEGLARGLFAPATTKRSVYENLLLYIQQEAAGGHKPAVVEDPVTRKFRINRPVDDWPAATLPPHPRYIDQSALDAIAARLRTTGDGNDATAFEEAVCDAFGRLGFVTRHVGGLYAPDGILDAPLGPLAYRAIVECKSSPHVKFVSQPRPEEAAKFRASSNADFAVLVGPDFHAGESFSQEIQTTESPSGRWTISSPRSGSTSTRTNAARSSPRASSTTALPTSNEAVRTARKSEPKSFAASCAAKATPPSVSSSATSRRPTPRS
jgi:hypothetical protein